MPTLRNLLTVIGLFLVLPSFGQYYQENVNGASGVPGTRSRSPLNSLGRAPGAGYTVVTDANGNLRIADFPNIQTSAIAYVPTATGNTSNRSEYVTDPNGNRWYIDWLGNAMMLLSTPLNGVTNITTPNVGTGLGGTLIRNTTIDGEQKTFAWTDLLSWSATATNNSTSGTVSALFQPFGASSNAYISVTDGSATTQNALLSINPSTGGTADNFGTSGSRLSASSASGTGTTGHLSAFTDRVDLGVIDLDNSNNSRGLIVATDGIRLWNPDAGTATKMLYWNPTTKEVTQADAPSGGGGSAATIVTTVGTQDFYSTAAGGTTTLVDVTGLSFSCVSGTKYRVRGHIIYGAQATGHGISLAVTGPGNSWVNYVLPQSGTATKSGAATSGYNDAARIDGTSSANVGLNSAVFDAIIDAQSSGTFKVQAACESGVGTSNFIQIQSNSSLTIQEI